MVNDLELARRAVACKRWRWIDGMLAIPVGGGPAMRLCGGFALDPREWLPVLSDPATLGCLLALVREAWGKPGLFVAKCHAEVDGHDGWMIIGALRHLGPGGCFRDPTIYGDTEAEALVAALEAAP